MPIIFITGYGDVPMSVRAMKAGAVEFLTKPFKDEVLLQGHPRCDRGVAPRSSRSRDAITATPGIADPREREVMALVCPGC